MGFSSQFALKMALSVVVRAYSTLTLPVRLKTLLRITVLSWPQEIQAFVSTCHLHHITPTLRAKRLASQTAQRKEHQMLNSCRILYCESK